MVHCIRHSSFLFLCAPVPPFIVFLRLFCEQVVGRWRSDGRLTFVEEPAKKSEDRYEEEQLGPLGKPEENRVAADQRLAGLVGSLFLLDLVGLYQELHFDRLEMSHGWLLRPARPGRSALGPA